MKVSTTQNGHFTPEEITPNTNCKGRYLDPKTGLDLVTNKKSRSLPRAFLNKTTKITQRGSPKFGNVSHGWNSYNQSITGTERPHRRPVEEAVKINSIC